MKDLIAKLEDNIYWVLLIGLLIPSALCLLSVGPWELNVGIFILVLAMWSFVMGSGETGREKSRSIGGGIFGLLLGTAFLIDGISKIFGR